MKYQIINCNDDVEIGLYLLEKVILSSYNNNNCKILSYWSDSFKEIYKIIFNFDESDKKIKKLIKRKEKKQIENLYNDLTLVNMYEFLGSEKEELNSFSTERNFRECIDKRINFISFSTDENGKIDIDLLMCPHNHDKKIKSCSENIFNLAIIRIDSSNMIPFVECYIENIGTNISSINFDDWTENEDEKFDQTINIGTKFLSNCKKICVILDESEIKDIFGNEKNTVISRILKSHDNVTYLIKKNK